MLKNHTFTRSVIKNTAYFLTLFFTFILFSAIIGRILQPSFSSINTENIPALFPIAVTWTKDTGNQGCRIIFHHQLEDLQKNFPSLKFDITEKEMEACSYAIDYLKVKKRWPHKLTDDTHIVLSNAHILHSTSLEGTQFEIDYSDEKGMHNASIYQVQNNTILVARYCRYKNTNYSYKAMPYSLIATLLLWWFYKLFKSYQKRHQRQSEL